ncbi:hypothetical protein [Sinorhizobium sp. BG8]|uniref:hypothetical protein n=1 Tax=Sinorhizobium sp. BG8 TaxID=2613773 RepID=UPI00193D6C88|nr:hypothetical protein [Sinorhizobium sp. BG8]QRM53737.1 hypothetical protein F3Y30_03560 [Sinorhizobium sp. BG8]
MKVFPSPRERFPGSFSTPLEFSGSSGQESAHVSPLLRTLAFACVLGGLLFNLVLCLVNTRLMGIAESHVMLSEMLIVGLCFLVAVNRRLGFYLLITVFVSYMVLLFALRGGQYNLKAIRDILIPIAFYFAGMRIKDPRLGDRLVVVSSAIVLVIGLFEYFLSDLFISYFNVIGYYVARGSVTVDQLYGQTQGLFISGRARRPARSCRSLASIVSPRCSWNRSRWATSR